MNVQFVLHSLNSTPHTISNGNTQEVMSVQSLVHTKVKYPYFTDHNIGLQNAMCSSHTSHNFSVATHNASVHKATYFYTPSILRTRNQSVTTKQNYESCADIHLIFKKWAQ